MQPEGGPAVAGDHWQAVITSRRSIAPKRLCAPGPAEAEIATMVGAALRAPDHGSLRPWRIVRVAEDGRHRLAEVFVAAKRRRLPDPAPGVLEREREKALNAPVLLVVCARPRTDRADIPVYEQLIAVGAAVQNLLLVAHGLGYGASLLSGEKARDPLVRHCLGLQPDEILVGFLSIGSIAKPAPSRPGEDVSAFLTVWNAPSPAFTEIPAELPAAASDFCPADTQLALPL